MCDMQEPAVCCIAKLCSLQKANHLVGNHLVGNQYVGDVLRCQEHVFLLKVCTADRMCSPVALVGTTLQQHGVTELLWYREPVCRMSTSHQCA